MSVWLEMAEKRLELIERDLDEEPDDGHLLQRTKVRNCNSVYTWQAFCNEKWLLWDIQDGSLVRHLYEVSTKTTIDIR